MQPIDRNDNAPTDRCFLNHPDDFLTMALASYKTHTAPHEDGKVYSQVRIALEEERHLHDTDINRILHYFLFRFCFCLLMDDRKDGGRR